LRQSLALWPRLALNLRSLCLSFPSAGITGMHHQMLPPFKNLGSITDHVSSSLEACFGGPPPALWWSDQSLPLPLLLLAMWL
jgi:hypothetical protein